MRSQILLQFIDLYYSLKASSNLVRLIIFMVCENETSSLSVPKQILTFINKPRNYLK